MQENMMTSQQPGPASSGAIPPTVLLTESLLLLPLDILDLVCEGLTHNIGFLGECRPLLGDARPELSE